LQFFYRLYRQTHPFERVLYLDFFGNHQCLLVSLLRNSSLSPTLLLYSATAANINFLCCSDARLAVFCLFPMNSSKLGIFCNLGAIIIWYARYLLSKISRSLLLSHAFNPINNSLSGIS